MQYISFTSVVSTFFSGRLVKTEQPTRIKRRKK